MVKPRRLIGTPKRLLSPQMRRSHISATSRPPPTQTPWIIAIVGWMQSPTACIVGMRSVRRIRVPCATLARTSREFRRCRRRRAKAWSPAPRRTTQRKLGVGRRVRASARQLEPRRLRQRVELGGRVEHDGRDRAVAFDEDQVGHPRSASRSSATLEPTARRAESAPRPPRAAARTAARAPAS